MLLIPIYLHGKHTGFVSFEMCNQIRIWQKDEVQLLKTFGNIISTSFERKNIEEKRIRVEHNLREANVLIKRKKFKKALEKGNKALVEEAKAEGSVLKERKIKIYGSGT